MSTVKNIIIVGTISVCGILFLWMSSATHPMNDEVDASVYTNIRDNLNESCPQLKPYVKELMEDKFINGWEYSKFLKKCNETNRLNIKKEIKESFND